MPTPNMSTLSRRRHHVPLAPSRHVPGHKQYRICPDGAKGPILSCQHRHFALPAFGYSAARLEHGVEQASGQLQYCSAIGTIGTLVESGSSLRIYESGSPTSLSRSHGPPRYLSPGEMTTFLLLGILLDCNTLCFALNWFLSASCNYQSLSWL